MKKSESAVIPKTGKRYYSFVPLPNGSRYTTYGFGYTTTAYSVKHLRLPQGAASRLSAVRFPLIG